MMKTIFKIALLFVIAFVITSFLSSAGVAQTQCSPGTPHIEMLDHPGDPFTHREALYMFEFAYPPYFPNDSLFAELHCGSNNLYLIDPCNPWRLEFFIVFYDEENDMVKLRKPIFNWDTALCQDIKFEVVNQPTWNDATSYIDPLIPGSGIYYDSVVMKVTMTPHPIVGCTPDGIEYECYDGHKIYNKNCWNQTCLNKLITFSCIDSCEFPNTAICLMNFDSPLPVELTSFAAIVDNENVILKWTTATEKDNAGFDIERKTDGVWNKIGYISGKGNSEVPVDYTFLDKKLNPGSYYYRLKQIDYNGNFEYLDLAGSVNIGVPDKFSMSQNYPNPFNPVTKINIALPNDGNVMMKIYDLSGREMVTVINEFRTAGYYTIDFDASNLASGIYYYKLTAGDNVAVNKMAVIK